MRVHQNRSRYYRQPPWLVRLLVHLAWLLAVVMLVLPPRALMAQSAPVQAEEVQAEEVQADESDEDEFFSDAHRRRMYEQSSLSTSTAVLYNLALPGLGNIYAEQYFYAGIALTLMVFTLVFEGYGLVTDQSEFLWIGAGTALIAYGGSIATSIVGVNEYNRKLREGLKLEVSQGPFEVPRARTVNLSFQF